MTSSNDSTKDSDNDQYFSYSDPYRTKDLIWDAYFGFITQYGVYMMYRSIDRRGLDSKKGITRYAVDFYGEVRDFLDKIYPDEKMKSDLYRLDRLFNVTVLKLEDSDILFLRRFFGKFMVDCGMKNVLYLKDTSKPGEKFMNERYPDIEKSKQK